MPEIKPNRQNLHAIKKVESMGFATMDDFITYMLTIEREKPSYIAKFLGLAQATIKNYRKRLNLPRLKKIELLGPSQLQEYEYTDRCYRCNELIINIYNFKSLKRSERSYWCDNCRRILFGEDKR